MTTSLTHQTGGETVGRQAPNTLLLGSGTAVIYDSNALSSRPPLANVEYTIYPRVGLSWSRPRWDALVDVVPGFSYSSANLPQYQTLSLTSSIDLQYRASPRLIVDLRNNLISSTNLFNSLTVSTPTAGATGSTEFSSALNYLPQTNEMASVDVAYNLSARTSVTALASYNYRSYQYDPHIPSDAQPFQTVTIGAVDARSSSLVKSQISRRRGICGADP